MNKEKFLYETKQHLYFLIRQYKYLILSYTKSNTKRDYIRNDIIKDYNILKDNSYDKTQLLKIENILKELEIID